MAAAAVRTLKKRPKSPKLARPQTSPGNTTVIFGHTYPAQSAKMVMVSVGLLIFIALLPGRMALSKASQYKAAAAKADTQTHTLQGQIDLANQVVANPTKYKTLQDQVLTALPGTYSQSDLITLLTQIAQSTGVTWIQGNPPAATLTPVASASAGLAPGVTVYTFTVNLAGTTPQILAYIQALQANSRAMTVLNVSINTSTHSTDNPGGSSAQINAQTYSWTAPTT